MEARLIQNRTKKRRCLSIEDDDREAKRQRLASVTTSQPKPELMSTERFWDHVNGGKMRVFERVPYEVAKARMRKEPNKVRWVDTLKGSGIHRSRLVAKEFRRGSKYEGFANFSATPPLELVKLIISLVATAQRDPELWFGWREHGAQ